jgi:hypothetical protein
MRSRPRPLPPRKATAKLRALASGAARAALVPACGLLPFAVLLSSEAHAAEDNAPVAASPAVRRSGFLLGVSGGLAVASASGYPNDVAKIDLPEFEAGTGASVSNGGAIWVGGALADWLSISLGFQGGGFKGKGIDASGGGIHVRVETFPLFYRGGSWQDLGLSFTAGTGSYQLKRGTTTVAEGEGTSAVGAGIFFEPWRFWRFSTGPDLSYAHHFSRSFSAHSLVVGWRLAFYGGP